MRILQKKRMLERRSLLERRKTVECLAKASVLYDEDDSIKHICLDLIVKISHFLDVVEIENVDSFVDRVWKWMRIRENREDEEKQLVAAEILCIFQGCDLRDVIIMITEQYDACLKNRVRRIGNFVKLIHRCINRGVEKNESYLYFLDDSSLNGVCLFMKQTNYNVSVVSEILQIIEKVKQSNLISHMCITMSMLDLIKNCVLFEKQASSILESTVSMARNKEIATNTMVVKSIATIVQKIHTYEKETQLKLLDCVYIMSCYDVNGTRLLDFNIMHSLFIITQNNKDKGMFLLCYKIICLVSYFCPLHFDAFLHRYDFIAIMTRGLAHECDHAVELLCCIFIRFFKRNHLTAMITRREIECVIDTIVSGGKCQKLQNTLLKLLFNLMGTRDDLLLVIQQSTLIQHIYDYIVEVDLSAVNESCLNAFFVRCIILSRIFKNITTNTRLPVNVMDKFVHALCMDTQINKVMIFKCVSNITTADDCARGSFFKQFNVDQLKVAIQKNVVCLFSDRDHSLLYEVISMFYTLVTVINVDKTEKTKNLGMVIMATKRMSSPLSILYGNDLVLDKIQSYVFNHDIIDGILSCVGFADIIQIAIDAKQARHCHMYELCKKLLLELSTPIQRKYELFRQDRIFCIFPMHKYLHSYQRFQ